MALVFHSGFEMGLFGEWISVTGSPTLTTPHTGSYGLTINAAVPTYVTANSITVKRFTFWVNVYSLRYDEETTIFGSDNSGGRIRGYHGYDEVYSLRIYDGATLRGTIEIQRGVYIRVSGGINGGTATDWVAVNGVVGVSDVTISALGAVNLGIITDPSGIDGLYADDVVFDDTFSTTDLGDIRCAVVANPNAIGDVTTIFDTIVGGVGGVHYTAYDDPAGTAVETMDNDYVQQAAKAAVQDIANLDSCADIGLVSTDVIDAVRVMMYCQGAATAGVRVRTLAGTDYDTSLTWSGAAQWLNSTYYVLDPAGNAWTQTNFDGFQAGQYTASHATDQFLYCVMVFVAYHSIAVAVPRHGFVNFQDPGIV